MTAAPNKTTNTEAAVIGALVRDPARYFEIAEYLAPHQIQDGFLRSVYAAIGQATMETSAVNLHMVADRLPNAPDGFDAYTYLATLAEEARGVGESLDAMVSDLAEAAARADQAAAMSDLMALVKEGIDATEFAARAIDRLTVTVPRTKTKTRGRLGHLLREHVNALAQSQPLSSTGGIKTGLTDLDAQLGAILPGELVILAGRPGFGKSALSMQIVMELAQAGRPVSVYNMEMDIKSILNRILATRARIPSAVFRRQSFTTREKEAVYLEGQALADQVRDALEIDATPGMTMAQIRARALARRSREGDLALLVVDHSKLFRIGTKIDENEIARIAEGFRMMKDLAKECGCVVLALSQFKSFALQRDIAAKSVQQLRPRVEDLYGGSAPREFADIVLLGHRPFEAWKKLEPVKHESPEHHEWAVVLDHWRDRAEIIIDKFRGGAEGQIIEVAWDGPSTSFRDLKPNVDTGDLLG